ncbi:MFS transporter [Salinivibrio kushneri]|uniref:multidrug effflux MFS transporter n=1 Tax=Salinivibrio kushneri TaxID=1908198 RepID=UPI000988A99D|nr:multidrug effflux MFS transporter [Salinivibrio kushneri]OOE35488.1 MFS transporter [Salinivibrio kushneri]
MQSASRPFNWSPVLLACLTVSIGQFSMGLVFPSLPWIARDFNLSMDNVQLLISAYLLGFGPSQFIYGPISDALGRRRVLLAGVLLSLIGLTVMVSFSASFTGLVIGRCIQGMGTGCCAVLSRAFTRDSYSGDQLPQAMSYLIMVASFTPIVAPVIGGFVNHNLGWLAIFILLMVYTSLVWCVLFFLFKESMHARSPLPNVKVILGRYGALLKTPYFLYFASISWLNFTLVITTVSLMPFLMQERIGMTSDQYALWALIPTCGLLLGSTLVSRIRPRLGTKRMLLMAPMMQLTSAVWLWLTPMDPLLLMIGQFFMVFGNGIALPCAQSQVMQPYSNQAGTVAALSGGGQMIISALMSMALLGLGVSEAWHLGIVVGVFALLSVHNIFRGFTAPKVNVASTPSEAS